jgi:hypothetical protein
MQRLVGNMNGSFVPGKLNVYPAWFGVSSIIWHNIRIRGYFKTVVAITGMVRTIFFDRKINPEIALWFRCKGLPATC